MERPGENSRALFSTTFVSRLDDVTLLQLVQFRLNASQSLIAVDHQEVLSGGETENRVAIAVVIDRRVRRIVSVAKRKLREDDLSFADRRTGVSKVGVGEIVQRVFGEHVGLSEVRQIDVAQLAQCGEAESSGCVHG